MAATLGPVTLNPSTTFETGCAKDLVFRRPVPFRLYKKFLRACCRLESIVDVRRSMRDLAVNMHHNVASMKGAMPVRHGIIKLALPHTSWEFIVPMRC